MGSKTSKIQKLGSIHEEYLGISNIKLTLVSSHYIKFQNPQLSLVIIFSFVSDFIALFCLNSDYLLTLDKIYNQKYLSELIK